MKHEVQTECVAMLRDHVTEEDTETFARVQELAAQVRKRVEKVLPGGELARKVLADERNSLRKTGIL